MTSKNANFEQHAKKLDVSFSQNVQEKKIVSRWQWRSINGSKNKFERVAAEKNCLKMG